MRRLLSPETRFSAERRRTRYGSRARLVLGAACVAAATCWAATQAAGASSGPSADEIVAARQASMAMSAALLGTIKLASERGAAADTQAYQASGLSRWAKALPAMFPTGTAADAVTAPTRARPEIWTQRAGFEKSSNDLIAATAKLLELAKDKDTSGFKDQIAVVHDACESCHQAFMKK